MRTPDISLRVLKLLLGEPHKTEPLASGKTQYEWPCDCEALCFDGDRCSVSWCAEHEDLPRVAIDPNA